MMEPIFVNSSNSKTENNNSYTNNNTNRLLGVYVGATSSIKACSFCCWRMFPMQDGLRLTECPH